LAADLTTLPAIVDFYPHLVGWWVFISNPSYATENICLNMNQISTDQIHGLILEEVCELKSSKLKLTARFSQPHVSPNKSVVNLCSWPILVAFLYECSRKSVGP